MSNPAEGKLTRGELALALALGALASRGMAQEPATLEAVRLGRPDALERARAELAHCVAARAPDAGTGDGGGASCPASRLSLLVGYLALAAGEARAAREQLASQPAPDKLDAFHAFYLAQAEFYSGNPGAAARQFERAVKLGPPWLASAARARLGEALLGAGEPLAAAPHLEQAALERATPELYFQRAQVRRALGNLDGARADLRLLALRFPAHPYGQSAIQSLLAVRGKGVLLTLEERLTRARGFLAAGEALSAIEELERALGEKLARGASAQARLALLKAQAHFARGEEVEAQRQVEVALKGQAPVASEALLLRARRILRLDNRKGRAALVELERRFPRESAANDAGFLIGWLDLQAGRFAEAVKAFQSFEKRHASSRKRDEALWFKALALLRLERYAEATQALEALSRDFPRSSLVPQARYWATRSRQLSAKREAGEATAAAYAQVISLFPGSFYSLLASERLRELGRAPPPTFPQPPRKVEAKAPAELSLAIELASAGLLRDAAEEVEQRLGAVRGTEQALRFGHALQALGEYGAAHALAVRTLWGAAYGSKEPGALALMYPRAFRASVERYAEQSAVDPYLMWAIMRRESAFRPEVASAADARGLMQVIPPTATEVARRLQLEPPRPEELFAPELNLRLASWYLSALEKRFGHPALAAAAYNAGPAPVARWAQEKRELPLDLWVEEIPYKETRGYVKQVVADYYVYRALYAAPELRLSLAVPAPGEGVDF